MAGSSALGFSAGRCGLILSARAAERAVVQRCPVQGNSPSDRKDYPDFESPQESLHRCPPTRSMTRTVARRECAPASEPQARNLAFSGIAESFGPMCRVGISKAGAGVPPPVGRSRAQLLQDATEGARLAHRPR